MSFIDDQIINVDVFTPGQLFADNKTRNADDPAGCARAGDLVARLSLFIDLRAQTRLRVLRPKLREHARSFSEIALTRDEVDVDRLCAHVLANA